ncbi:isoprenylcysteine carboxylmethyltransferase family protein [bacterium]|nr:MAG: isoprenylcysteine carboxylmethyltransferase family protein [bacterium]
MLRQLIVVSSGLVYWGGVIFFARRVRRQIGRSPNLKPRGLKERLLWSGWFMVITGWIGQPFFIGRYNDTILFRFIDFLDHPYGIVIGTGLACLGYAGTLWCYAALGNAWRIGINRKEKTVLIQHGPYRFVRHPIYLFQVVLLIGMLSLLPTPFSILVLLIHCICIFIKALDEETYLTGIHNSQYREYHSRTGRFLPKWKGLQFFQ